MLKPPVEGNRSVPISILWQRDGVSPGFAVEFNAQSQRVVPISQISALYVDNSRCASTVEIFFPDTDFTIVAPSASTGYYPVISNTLRFQAFCNTIPGTNDLTFIQVLNFLPPALALQSTPFAAAAAVTEVDTGPGLTGGPIVSTGTVSLITPVALVNGGTGSSTPAGALANLGGAPIASPMFTGAPSLPASSIAVTQPPGNNSTAIATTAFVTGSFAPLASPALTGLPTVPTAAPGTNTTQAASTGFVATSFAPLASPALTGTPTAPSAAGNVNTTQIATTAFSRAMLGARALNGSNAPVDPVGSSSTTTYTHCGYGVLLTPAISGRVLICFFGVMTNSVAGGGGALAMRYGTGTAPVNAAAVTGTAPGASQPIYFVGAPAPPNGVPFCYIAVATGLVVGTQYWFDLIQRSQATGTFSIANSNNFLLEV